MSHNKIYRICLLSLVIFTVIGGIFYYLNYVKNEASVMEGTLVMEWQEEQQNHILNDRI
ncbi:MAG: hypothetical protein RSD28_05305 [Lachnospiraceae bacterium]